MGNDEEDVLLDEGIFRLGSDSSPPAQNDNARGNDLGKTEVKILMREGCLVAGLDSSPPAQNDNAYKHA